MSFACAEWTSCVTPGDASCPQGWAEESTALACTYAYTDENGEAVALLWCSVAFAAVVCCVVLGGRCCQCRVV